METQVDTLWVLALASKCKALSSEYTIFGVVFLCITWLTLALCYWAYCPGGPAWGKYWWKRSSAKNIKPIPGPRGLPVIGSMSLMVNLAHHKLTKAAEWCNAKRLMAFSVGETRFIITSSPDVAKEILNSSVFADRPVKESAYSLMFNRAIGFAPYGVYWRTLRRIASTHLFCTKQINASEAQRSKIASQMVSMTMIACNSSSSGGEFSVRDTLKRASLNNMMCSTFGRNYDLSQFDSETEELSQLVSEGYDLLGKLNWSDHLPWIAGLDLQGIRFRCSNIVPRVNRFVNRIIQEHKEQTGQRNHDFVDVLLSLQGPDKLSESDMVAVLWVSNKHYIPILFYLNIYFLFFITKCFGYEVC